MNPLLNALPMIAQFVGQKLGVKVVIGAAQACTDGDVIYLPALPGEDQRLAVYANGWIDHEGAHVRSTDFTQVLPTRALTRGLFNVLEDVRIEHQLQRELPGTRQHLDRLRQAMVSDDIITLASETQSEAALLQCYLLQRLNVAVLGRDSLAGHADQAERLIRARLSAPVMARLNALAYHITELSTTAQSIALAERMVTMFEQAQTEASGQPDQSEASAQPDDPEASGQGADAGVQTTAATITALLAATDADLSDQADWGALAAQKIDAMATRAGGMEAMARVETPTAGQCDAPRVQQVRAATVALRRRLSGLLEARRRDRTWRSAQGRRLDRRSLTRLLLGDPAVFEQKRRRPALNTAVKILCDRSGSMTPRIDLACDAILALAVALRGLDIAVSVDAFPGNRADGIRPLLDFDESVHAVASRFSIGADGGTPMASALWRAAFSLLQRRESRRLLVIVTDGRPSNRAQVSDLVSRLRAGGIEVLGLGIGGQTQVVQLLGERFAGEVHDLHSLAPVLFQLLERHLVYSSAA